MERLNAGRAPTVRVKVSRQAASQAVRKRRGFSELEFLFVGSSIESCLKCSSWEKAVPLPMRPFLSDSAPPHSLQSHPLNNPRALSLGLVVVLFANRHFPPGQADLGKDGRFETKRLVHVGHDLDHLADKITIRVLDGFGNETRADRLAIGVERDLSGWRFKLKRRRAPRGISYCRRSRSPSTLSSASSTAIVEL